MSDNPLLSDLPFVDKLDDNDVMHTRTSTIDAQIKVLDFAKQFANSYRPELPRAVKHLFISANSESFTIPYDGNYWFYITGPGGSGLNGTSGETRGTRGGTGGRGGSAGYLTIREINLPAGLVITVTNVYKSNYPSYYDVVNLGDINNPKYNYMPNKTWRTVFTDAVDPFMGDANYGLGGSPNENGTTKSKNIEVSDIPSGSGQNGYQGGGGGGSGGICSTFLYGTTFSFGQKPSKGGAGGNANGTPSASPAGAGADGEPGLPGCGGGGGGGGGANRSGSGGSGGIGAIGGHSFVIMELVGPPPQPVS